MAGDMSAAVEYFSRFRAARLPELFEMTRGYKINRTSGYQPFPGHEKVNQFFLDVTLNLEEVFSDLRIPEGFSTPNALLSAWRNFKSLMVHYGAEFAELRTERIEAGRREVADSSEYADHDFISEPLTWADATRQELDELLAEVLRIAEGDAATTANVAANPLDKIANLFNRFHRFAIQLRRRHGDRNTIQIGDEYDVQDVMHALLRLEFDDVRDEEYTPSYAGGSTRIDFVLPQQRVAIEVKMTRTTLKDAQVGTELIADAARYASHPDVDTLICFVYDPSALLKNPDGLQADLEKLPASVNIQIFIRPNH